MNEINNLKIIPLLAGIPDEDLQVLAGMMKERKIKSGDNIIVEGETGDEVFFLMEGTVDIIKSTVYGEPFVVATLDAQSHCVFGEMAVIDSDRRSATVRAKTGCIALSVTREDFDRFCCEKPRSGIALLKLISINLVRNIRAENENLKMVYQALIEEIESA